jgi:ketosteroid isomerase-like protein
MFEVPTGIVSVVEDGLVRLSELHDYDDEARMLARYAELGGGLSALGDRPPELWLREFAPRFARQQLEPMVELISPEYTLIDHRQIGWEPVTGRDGFAAVMKSVIAEGRARYGVDEVLACDERVLAVKLIFSGHSLGGSSPWELQIGVVTVVEDGKQVRAEYLDPGDGAGMIARFVELGGRHEAVSHDRPPVLLHTEFDRRLHGRDVNAMLDLLADNFVMRDHRATVSQDIRDRESLRAALESVLEISPDVRLELDEVIACDDRVIAARAGYRGHAADGGGEFFTPVGVVEVVENGQFVSADDYDYEDTDALIARFVELGGGLAALGDSPVERLCAEFYLRFARRGMESLLELVSEDYELIDRRQLGWEPTRGHDGFRAAMTGAWDVREIHVEVDEVLAVADNAIALRAAWVGHTSERAGGGAFSVEVGQVGVFEDGRVKLIEQFDAGDREAMLARFAELSGVGDRPPELFSKDEIRSYNARDLDAFFGLFSEDYSVVDHRLNGWATIAGREALRAQVMAGLAGSAGMRFEVDEMIACDERVMARRVAYRGHATEGGGEFEMPLGEVTVHGGGRVISSDVYEYDDTPAMIARYAELGGGLAVLAGSPPERWYAEFAKRFARQSVALLLELIDEYLLIDHRQLGWEPVRGRSGFTSVVQSAYDNGTIWMEFDRVLASEDRVIAFTMTHRGRGIDGGAAWELPLGVITVVDGKKVISEYFDPGQSEAMLARFAELSASETDDA